MHIKTHFNTEKQQILPWTYDPAVVSKMFHQVEVCVKSSISAFCDWIMINASFTVAGENIQDADLLF